VAIGGGGIKPMQRLWERGIERAQIEMPQVRAQAQQNKEAVQQKTSEWRSQAPDAGETAAERARTAELRPQE
jgi:hypothetical protein